MLRFVRERVLRLRWRYRRCEVQVAVVGADSAACQRGS